MFLRVLVLVCVFLLPFQVASANDADTLWSHATEEMAKGADAKAVELLQTLSEQFPESGYADDSLFLAGQLLEEKLGNPVQARILYRKLIEVYPESRASLAASRRVKALAESLGADNSGVTALVRFRSILREFPSRSLAESEALAEELLLDFPDWPGSYQVQLWLASAARSKGDLDAAQSYYDKVQAGQAPSAAQVQAGFGAVEVLIIRGQHSAAESTLDTLRARAGLSQGEIESIRELREKLGTSRTRSRLLMASLITFFAMLIGFVLLLRRHLDSWQQVARALGSPPSEVLYLLPISLLFVAMALTGHEEIGPAVSIICGGGLVVSWLAGRTMASMVPLRPAKAALCAVLATCATISLCYYALYRSQLLDLVATTVQFGPE